MTAYHHFAYGDRLRSSIPIPELRSAEAGPARWSFEVVEWLPEPRDAVLQGEEPLYADVVARFYRHAEGYRIVVEDTGSFDLSADGSEIRWLPNPDPWWDFGRSHLLGRVLATSLQLAGTLTLHGSGVEMADGVVGFLAPKHFGKSTLALSLFDAGARFVTDDALPVQTGERAMALPGVQSLRARPGDPTVERFSLDGPLPEPGRDGKIGLPPFPPERVLTAGAPLAALYFLAPFRGDGVGDAVRRTRLPGPLAAIRLLSQTKIGRMLGSPFARALFEESSSLVARTPVYELSIARDLSRIPEVVEAIIDWHGLPERPAATSAS